MSLLFGGGGAKQKPQFSGLSVQTSTSAIPITIGYGKNRSSFNIIWQGDFKTTKKKQKAGKGGPSQTTYTYSGSYIMALGWGVANGVTRVWKDQSKITDYTQLGFSFFSGTTPQSPWGFMTASHPTEALGYPGISYLAVANYDLGQSNSLPQHSFEVQWPLYNTQSGGTGDADPAQIVQDFLINTSYGVGFNFSVFNQASIFSTAAAPTTGDNAYQTYCRAMGFGLSPVMASQEAAREALERWAKLTNTAIVWNGYEIKTVPYGSQEVTANGVHYLPNFPVRYSLSDADFIRGGDDDPIKFDRVDPADAKNGFTITISNRNNEYNELPVAWRDQGLVDQFGYKKADPMAAREVCEPAMAATIVALIGQRIAYVRNRFFFTVGPQYALIEPMDVLECVDPILGTFQVLVTGFDETDDDQYEVEAEEYYGAVTQAASSTVQSINSVPVNTAVVPASVNTPIIFEPPSSLQPTPQVWAAVSGGDGTTFDPNWGGAFVWLSTDNITYNQIGTVESPARMGKLTAILPTFAGANPDLTSTLAVNLGMSGGQLNDATTADAAAGLTVCYVDGEFISYELATGTGTYTFNFTKLYRALHGSAVGAHAIGTLFARLDGSIFKYDLPAAYINKPLYLKFQSYNQYGAAVQDITTCTVYNFTPTGKGFGTGTDGKPATPTGFVGTAGAGFASLSWTANPVNDMVTGYEVWRAPGTGAAFGTAAKVATAAPTATSFQDTTAVPGTAYTFFLVAINKLGSSGNTAGQNVTPTDSTAPQPFGFAFQWPDPVVSKPIGYFDTPIAWSIPAGLANSQGSIGDSTTATALGPIAQTDFDIQSPPGTSIGTMRFAISAVTATFIKATASAIPLGQAVVIVAPASLNGLAGMVYGSIRGTR